MSRYFVLRLSFLVTVPLLLLVSCPSPLGSGSPTSSTGEINGHARYIGQSNHSGIIVSAEVVDSSGKTFAVKQALISVCATHRLTLCELSLFV